MLRLLRRIVNLVRAMSRMERVILCVFAGGCLLGFAGLLRLFYLEGLNYPGISLKTGIPQAQLGILLQRARDTLRKELGRDFPEIL